MNKYDPKSETNIDDLYNQRGSPASVSLPVIGNIPV